MSATIIIWAGVLFGLGFVAHKYGDGGLESLFLLLLLLLNVGSAILFFLPKP